jgi:hypothetical protein
MKRILRGVNRIARRASALERLETQLQSGYKTMTQRVNNEQWNVKILLSEKDITRIKSEIQILKSRI